MAGGRLITFQRHMSARYDPLYLAAWWILTFVWLSP